MTRSQKDQGLIIRKKKLLNGQVLVTILSEQSGKLVLSAFGIKKITSKRLSHFEIGNYISFTYTRRGDYLTLSETDLQFAHSGVKESNKRLSMMFNLFFILNKILPEGEQEIDISKQVLKLLRALNKEDMAVHTYKNYLIEILITGGYLDEEKKTAADFDVISFVEGLINEKVELDFEASG